MNNSISVLEIEGAWVELIESDSYINIEKVEAVFTVTARIRYQNMDARKKAINLLREKGWTRSHMRSDDFILRKILHDELRI